MTSSNRSSLTKPKFTRAPPRWVSLPKEDEISWLQSIAQLPLRATCAGLLVLVIPSRPASSEVPDGTWLFANRVAVQVFECSGLVCGRIVWLLRPRAPDGQPDIDRLNPDPNLRQRPLCGLTIIWGLHPDGAGHWSNGWLYDPQDGNTYDVTRSRQDFRSRLSRSPSLRPHRNPDPRPATQLRRTLLMAKHARAISV